MKGRYWPQKCRQAVLVDVFWTDPLAIQDLPTGHSVKRKSRGNTCLTLSLLLSRPCQGISLAKCKPKPGAKNLDNAVTAVSLPRTYNKVGGDASGSGDASTLRSQETLCKHIDVLHFRSLSQAAKRSRKLMFQNRLPDFKEPLQIRVSDYKHIIFLKKSERSFIFYLEDILSLY